MSKKRLAVILAAVGLLGDGSDFVGASGPATSWSFVEGCTRPGFQEWLTIQNRQADVSGSITASFPIVIERPIYFNYKNAITGGHDVCGYGVD